MVQTFAHCLMYSALLLLYMAVKESDDTMSDLRIVLVVGHHDDGCSLLVEALSADA